MQGKKHKQKKYYWEGAKLNSTLEKYLAKFPKGKALDVGAGGGRNSIFLAENGFEVEAIDKIEEGLEKIKNLAKEHKLKIKTKKCDINEFKFGKNKYSLVVATYSLDFLKKSKVNLILNKIKESVKTNGFVYLSVFSVKDPMYKSLTKKGIKQIEENTFYLLRYNTYRHFFTKNELQKKFKNFKIILMKQKRILDKEHDKPHYHNVIEMLAKKEKQQNNLLFSKLNANIADRSQRNRQ
ncbi:MAG: methyltransferase domain-containing protein [Candidatus Azambacteria bacterium]|nr:methyltransferase domain-containing protein [Candidatus Azambacteria bacterium]